MSDTRLWTWLALALCAALLAAPVSAQTPNSAPSAERQADPVEARVFEVHHRSLSDAADLVGELLSAEGSLTLKPKLGLLLIEDRAAVLDRVGQLLGSFDLPPRHFDVSMSLILGQRSDDAGGLPPAGQGSPLSTEVRGIMENVADFTQWTSYEPLGTRSVRGTEGERVVANLAGDYQVSFMVDSVIEAAGGTRVRFERFSLQREITLGDGGKDIEDLYTAGMVVDADKLTLVVAASAPDAKRALFLALQVEPR